MSLSNSFLEGHDLFDAPGTMDVSSKFLSVPSSHIVGECAEEVDLDYIIPLRLYGDGADAYRILLASLLALLRDVCLLAI